MRPLIKKGTTMLYSLKMRSAQGGPHERGGRHISGEERIVEETAIEACVHEMLERAKTHQRGEADFVNIKVQRVDKNKALRKPLLAFSQCVSATAEEGRRVALAELQAAGVTEIAAQKGIAAIRALPDSMRGAMLLNAETGDRMDSLGNRGVRVSNMDVDDAAGFRRALRQKGLHGLCGWLCRFCKKWLSAYSGAKGKALPDWRAGLLSAAGYGCGIPDQLLRGRGRFYYGRRTRLCCKVEYRLKWKRYGLPA